MSQADPLLVSDEDAAWEAVLDAIVTQRLAPGQRLSEHTLSAQFDISRSLARSLIERLLARQWLVSPSPRVTQVASLSALDIKQNFALRRMLLPSAWVQAAAAVDHQRLEALQTWLEQAALPADDTTALTLLKWNRQLNLLPCQATAYPLLASWAAELEGTAMRIYWVYWRRTGRLPLSLPQQRRLLGFLREDDPTAIRNAIADTLSQAEERVMTHWLGDASMTAAFVPQR